jgi:DNA-methyltransferase (dcm)
MTPEELSFYEIARICADKRPRCILLENVKGLLSHDNGKTFQTILGVFSDLGYDIQWQVLNSKNFGVPQNRERVFIVGYLGGEGRRQVFPITRDDEENTKRFSEGYNSSTLTTRVGSTAKQQPLVRAILTPDRAEKRQNGRRVKENGEPSFTLTGQDIHGVVLSPSLTTELAHSTGRDFTPNIAKALFKEGCQIRRLTPTECERLQGFPDGWTEGVSDSQRYKCLGNAVTTNVIT